MWFFVSSGQKNFQSLESKRGAVLLIVFHEDLEVININRLSCNEIFVIAEVEAVSNVLEVVTRLTGMRFAAFSHMTETHWTACAVHDELQFGISAGDALDIERTL